MNIYDPTITEWQSILQNMPKFRAEQVYSGLYKGKHITEITTIPKTLQAELCEKFDTSLPRVDIKLTSKIDGTVKYLFRMADNTGIESVIMPYKHGRTICISTQAGCRMGCAFCASTVDGLERNLTAGEMAGQILSAEKDLGERINHVVLMGSGEPLDNIENVLAFIENATHPKGLGISARHITLSTCGLLDGIRRLEELHLQINLAISLHAPNDTIRKTLMPIAKAVSVSALRDAAKSYFEKTHRRVTFEYALIQGVNDSREAAEELAALLHGCGGFHVNLIPVNKIQERTFQKSERSVEDMFVRILGKAGIAATVRRKMGADINAACGQLRKANKAER